MNIKIDPATASMIEQLMKWLEIEYVRDRDGFFINEPAIRDAFQKRHVRCAVIRGRVVGFSVGKYGQDIICVKQTHQRKGVGTALFNDCVSRAKADGVKELKGEAMPPDSITFWEKHGWQRERGSGRYGSIPIRYRISYDDQ